MAKRTSNLTCIVKDGKYVVAQFGSRGGNYRTRGVDILKFLNLGKNMDLLRAGLDRVVETKSHAKHSINSSGPDLLQKIQDKKLFGEPLYLKNQLSMAENGNLVDFVYVIDLDKGTFETYTGTTNSHPQQNERFFGFRRPDAVDKLLGAKPVVHLQTYELEEFPIKTSLYTAQISVQLKILKADPLSAPEPPGKAAAESWIAEGIGEWF